MKKIILLSIIFISSYSFSQNYIPLNLDSGIWIDETYSNNGIAGYPTDYYYTYYKNGDTIISSIKYFKFFCYYIGNPMVGPIQKDTFYWGLIRNDTLNKQVKVIRNNDTIEKLLYNFNCKIGDTLFDDDHNGAIIILVDSIEICGKYHKRFVTNKYTHLCGPVKYSRNDSICLIEGVGYSRGFIHSSFGICFEGGNTLLCYNEPGNSVCENCGSSPVKITNKQINNKVPQIIYNRQLQELQITGAEKIKAIKLISVSGQTIHEWNNCNGNCSLPLNSIKKGVYIAQCIFANGSVVNKKVVVY
ncbi:MAG: T9SS type A sorting domain-containing protein [Bacteroidales bacterium]|jgi:hypothetical protein